MAIIDPEGLFHGERLGACSDLAQLYWPRFFLAANGFARLELSYSSIISKIFGSFKKVPEASEIWGIFEEYAKNCLVVLYENQGVWWAQFDTSEKYLQRYKTVRDLQSPAPPPEVLEKYRIAHIAWKSANSLKNESFRKSEQDFGKFLLVRSGEGVGGGVGVGEDKDKNLPDASHPRPVAAQPDQPELPLEDQALIARQAEGQAARLAEHVAEEQARLLEKERNDARNASIERLFSYYCRKLGRDPTRYTLTDARRKKARSRLVEREKLSDAETAVLEARTCIDHLAASAYHREQGHIDWTEQIFRSADEFEKRLNWRPPAAGGGRNARPGIDEAIAVGQGVLDARRARRLAAEAGDGGGSAEAGHAGLESGGQRPAAGLVLAHPG